MVERKPQGDPIGWIPPTVGTKMPSVIDTAYPRLKCCVFLKASRGVDDIAEMFVRQVRAATTNATANNVARKSK